MSRKDGVLTGVDGAGRRPAAGRRPSLPGRASEQARAEEPVVHFLHSLRFDPA